MPPRLQLELPRAQMGGHRTFSRGRLLQSRNRLPTLVASQLVELVERVRAGRVRALDALVSSVTIEAFHSETGARAAGPGREGERLAAPALAWVGLTEP